MSTYVKSQVTRKNLFLSLLFNNVNYKDIKKMNVTKRNNKKYLNILFNNNTTRLVPYHEYKLNKKAAISTTVAATIGTCALAGTLASFKYSKNDNDITLNAYANPTTIEEVVETTTETEETNSVEPQVEVVTPTTPDIVAETPIETTSETTQEELVTEETTEDNYNENETIRYINVSGDSTRSVEVYEYIMNNYYDDILEYGITYGIDPSIIAALMMQEGSNIYDPTQPEDYYKIGFGQVNGSIWDGQSITVYNFVTQSYETYKINVMLLYNNPKEQIKLIAIMLQDNAVRYSGNLNAMFICYNQGMGTVSNIANSIVSSNPEYDNKVDVYTAIDPLLLDNANTYTYGDPEYSEKLFTFMDYILTNEDFGRDCASVTLPSGEVITYYISTDVELTR